MTKTARTGRRRPLVHEDSYKGIGPAAYLHRQRLRRTLELVSRLDLDPQGTLADFGCSNGFVLSVLQAKPFRGKSWKYFGFDYSEHLLSLARAKKLPDTEFHHLNLNEVSGEWRDRFDLITCFETLEHTGNYHNALQNLVESCKPGGKIVISIPNENGAPGLVKYLTRPLVRSKPYGNFFAGKSQARYLWHLLSSQDIDGFRVPAADGWGPHLGFDSRNFQRFLQ